MSKKRKTLINLYVGSSMLCRYKICLLSFIFLFFIFPVPVCLLSIESNLVKYSIGGVAGVRFGVIERACIELDLFIKKERN